ncbi:MAG: cytochrome c biogenesis CcdA family protein [Acidimicrobiales bacterium]
MGPRREAEPTRRGYRFNARCCTSPTPDRPGALIMGEFAVPFGLGIFAALNPCGFAMLPAYLSYFLGIESREVGPSRLRTVIRGLVVGTAMTIGFIAVFGSFGALFAWGVEQGTVLEVVPWVIIGIGVVLIPLGIAMAMGREFNVRLPKMAKGTGGRNLGSVFMFGVSYAVVSLSCTIGLFIPNVSKSFTDDGIATGTGNFLAYAIGMGIVVTFLTVSLALAKSNVAQQMRRVLPYIGRISGLVLVLAGIYLIDYGIWDYQVSIADNFDASNLMVDQFLEFQQATTDWIDHTTTERIGLVCLFGIVGALVAAWRDDNGDPTRDLLAVVGYLGAYGAVEAYNRGEFVLLPVARFVIGWPARIAHWFTDPLRFGVPLEMVFVALAVWFAGRRMARYRPRHVAGAVGAT